MEKAIKEKDDIKRAVTEQLGRGGIFSHGIIKRILWQAKVSDYLDNANGTNKHCAGYINKKFFSFPQDSNKQCGFNHVVISPQLTDDHGIGDSSKSLVRREALGRNYEVVNGGNKPSIIGWGLDMSDICIYENEPSKNVLIVDMSECVASPEGVGHAYRHANIGESFKAHTVCFVLGGDELKARPKAPADCELFGAQLAKVMLGVAGDVANVMCSVAKSENQIAAAFLRSYIPAIRYNLEGLHINPEFPIALVKARRPIFIQPRKLTLRMDGYALGDIYMERADKLTLYCNNNLQLWQNCRNIETRGGLWLSTVNRLTVDFGGSELKSLEEYRAWNEMRLMKNKRRLRIGKTDEGDDMEDIMFGDNLGLGKKAKLPVLKPVTITRFKGEVDDLPFDLGPNLGWFIDYPYDDETLKRATLVAT